MSNLNLNVEFCCTCLKLCSDKDKFLSLNFAAPHELTYRNKLKSCVPEMRLQNVEEFFLCKPCSISLENAYNFRCMCLRSDNKLEEFRNLRRESVKGIDGIREDLLQLLSRDDLKRPISQIPRPNNTANRSILEQIIVIDDNDEIVSHSKIETAKELGSLLTESLGSANKKKRETDSANILQSLNAQICKIKKLPSYSVHHQTSNNTRTELTDEDLIKKACKRIPDLRNVPTKSLQCQVSLERIIVKELPVIVPNTTSNSNVNAHKKETFYCKVCDKHIVKKERYYSHVLMHANIRAYKCNLCPSGYFSSDALRIHKRKAHTDTPQTSQTGTKIAIKIGSKTEPLIVSSQKTNRQKKKNAGEKCVLKIKLGSGKQPNKPTANSKREKMYHCNSCNYKTPSRYLSEHHSLKHTSEASYRCTVCSKTYYAQWELNRHMRNTHNKTSNNSRNKKTNFTSPPVKKIKTEPVTDHELTINTSNLCREMSNFNSAEEQLGCTICGQKFTHEKEFKKHLKTHTLDVQQPNASVTNANNSTKKKKRYFCNICNSDFYSRDHANVHTGEKPYACNICAKTFAAYNSMRKHRNTHANNMAEKSTGGKARALHVCEICEREFKKASDVYSHDCQTASGESVYRCQICKNAYLGRSALIEHMRVHVGESGAAP